MKKTITNFYITEKGLVPVKNKTKNVVNGIVVISDICEYCEKAFDIKANWQKYSGIYPILAVIPVYSSF
jgi:hypothetical protein